MDKGRMDTCKFENIVKRTAKKLDITNKINYLNTFFFVPNLLK
jgi:hypothetical protein